MIIASKIILCGDNKVGKTSLRDVFFGVGFNSSYLPTIGADVSILNYEHKAGNIDVNLKLSIWDLAGQSIFFDKILTRFFTGSQGVLLMYDVTEKSSYNNIFRWLASIEKELDLDSTIIILIGNKIDLERIISREDGKELAKRISDQYFKSSRPIPYIETSALTRENVDKALNLIATTLIEKSQEN